MKTHTRRLIVLAALSLPALAAPAASLTWTNSAGDALWSNPANWSTTTVPAFDDELTFPSAIPGGVSAITLPDGAQAWRLIFQAPYTLTGGALELKRTSDTTPFGMIEAHTGTGSVNILTPIVGPQRMSFNAYSPTTLTLSPNNTFSGGRIDLSGTGVTITTDSAFGPATNAVFFYATLTADGTFDSHRTFNPGTSQAGINVTAGNTFRIHNLNGGGSQLDKFGPGTLALANALTNPFGGPPLPLRTRVYEGALRLEHPLAAGTDAGAFDALYLSAPGILEIACNDYNARRVDIAEAGATIRGGNGAASFTGTLDTNAKNFNLSGGPTDADSLLFNPATVLDNSSGNTASITGKGRVILTSTTPMVGRFTLAGGTLQLNATGILSPAPMTLSNGTLAASGISFPNTINLHTNGSLAPGDAPGTYTGAINIIAQPPPPGVTGIPSFKLSAPGVAPQNLTLSGKLTHQTRWMVTNPSGVPGPALILTNPTNSLPGNIAIYVMPHAAVTSAPVTKHGSTLSTGNFTLTGGRLNLLSNIPTAYNTPVRVGHSAQPDLPAPPPTSNSTIFVDRYDADSPGGHNHFIPQIQLPYPEHTLTIDAAHNTRLTVGSLISTSTLFLSPTATLSLSSAVRGTIDLAPGSKLVLPHAATPRYDEARARILANDITSSTPDPSNLLTLGYAPLPEPSGTSTLIRLTAPGDANLNGTIDPDDYALLDLSFATQPAAPHWFTGDFNYDNLIDQQDYLLIDASLARQAGLSPSFLSARQSQFGPAYVSELLTTIPEPSSAACGLALLLAHKKRRRAR